MSNRLMPMQLPKHSRTYLWVVAACATAWLIALASARTGAAAAPAPSAAAQSAPVPSAVAKPAVDAPANYREVVNRYCVTCHNERLKTAGLLLDQVDITEPSKTPEVWEKVIKKLHLGAMPPPDMPRPDVATLNGMIASLEGSLDATYSARSNPGRSPIHRLNRAEYRNTIRELLDLDIDVADMLPSDDSSYGFDNISDTLKISPLLVTRYLGAAERIAAVAVGDPEIGEEIRTWIVPADLSQNQQVPGMPLGTIGGMKVNYNFPLDAEYTFKAELWTVQFGGARGLAGLEEPYQFEIAIDGQRVLYVPIGGKEFNDVYYRSPSSGTKQANDLMQVRTRVSAGPHEVTFVFLPPSTTGVMQEHLQPTVRASASVLESFGEPKLRRVMLSGPANATGPGDTPSRRKVFICQPANPREDVPCATKVLSNLARRAYGRVPTSGELDVLMDFYRSARATSSFEGGVQAALPRILAGPEFLLRHHPAPANVAAGAVYPITDADLATRLALFLWSSVPDDQLLDLATQGKLRAPGVLEQQIRRMLVDPKAESLVKNFAGQWLFLRNLDSVAPALLEFPDFDDNLRQSFRQETEMFFGSIVREDRSLLDLLNADYTFVNEQLARHYGIPNVYGPRFRRVKVTDDNRLGLLGHGSVLTVSGVGTLPVVRGKWVLNQLLNSPPPAPPPVIPALPENDGKPKSLRELLETHRKNPPCSTCHRLMDPIGLALQNFDEVGKWRTTDQGQPIDATTTLFNGETVNGPVDLRRALLKRPEMIAATVTEKLLTYSLGRGVEPGDFPAVRAIVRDAARDNYRFSSIVLGIAKSVPFRLKVKQSASLQTADATIRP